jgi:hypothetical protein
MLKCGSLSRRDFMRLKLRTASFKKISKEKRETDGI